MRARSLVRLLFAPVLALGAAGLLSAVTAPGASAAPGLPAAPLGNTFGTFGHASTEGLGTFGSFFGYTYDCTGGNIPPGLYNSMTITGVCYMPAGNITIQGNLTIAPGALLDAVTPGDPSASPVVPATVVIGGNVSVGAGGAFLFGCSPNISCTSPPGITYDRIGGNLTGIGALGVVVHSASIGGSVTLLGGGGGPAAENCSAVTVPPSTPVPPAPWSEDANLDFTPVYTDFEDTTIGGSLNVSGLTSCWLGSFRNQIGGSATFVGNTMGDPDAMEIASNLIGGNMTCLDNTPGTPPPGTPQSTGVQFGDSGGSPNIVGGLGIGECGFNVVVPNPAPEADQGPGIPEHIAVSTWSLGTYYGTHTQIGPSVVTLPIGTTESGDVLSAEVNNVVLGGTGLTGTETYDPSQPLGSTGEAVAITAYPNGSESFTAYDNCTCTFDGQSGTVSIRAYGTVWPNGLTTGTFLVTSGGAGLGGLSTLAGYGTFTNIGAPAGTLRLVEHLRIT